MRRADTDNQAAVFLHGAGEGARLVDLNWILRCSAVPVVVMRVVATIAGITWCPFGKCEKRWGIGKHDHRACRSFPGGRPVPLTAV